MRLIIGNESHQESHKCDEHGQKDPNQEVILDLDNSYFLSGRKAANNVMSNRRNRGTTGQIRTIINNIIESNPLILSNSASIKSKTKTQLVQMNINFDFDKNGKKLDNIIRS